MANSIQKSVLNAAEHLKRLFSIPGKEVDVIGVAARGAIVSRGIIDKLGNIITAGDNGVGYVAGGGIGGAVTQATNSGTGVTLNTLAGQITTVALTTAAGGEEVFTVTNSKVKGADVPVVATTYAGAGLIAVSVKKVVDGAFDVMITNLHASAALNAAAVINFAVIKGATN